MPSVPAEAVEEAPVHRLGLDEPHRAAVAVRHDGLRAVVRVGERAVARRDLVERRVPTDRLEASFALSADSPQAGLDAVGAVRALVVVGDLRAERAAREGVCRVARDRDGAAVLDLHEHGAGVRAVVRAGGADDLRVKVLRHGWRLRKFTSPANVFIIR
jgi:predicted dithiol-disulfide oxidoreductase (DUF899 family)